MRGAFAHQAQEGLHRSRVGIPEIGFEECGVFGFEGTCLQPVIVQSRAHHFTHFARDFVQLPR